MTKHRRNATSLSASRKKPRNVRLDATVDKVEDFYETTPKNRGDNKKESGSKDLNLTLPDIRRSSPTKRALSAQGTAADRGFNIEPVSFSDFPTAIKRPSVTEQLIEEPEKIRTEGRDSSLKKEFHVKVLKNYTYDSMQKQRELKEKEEQEEKERQERRHANSILMEHGITASNSLQVSRRAAFERKLSSNSVSGINDMIAGYENEISEFKHRLELLE